MLGGLIDSKENREQQSLRTIFLHAMKCVTNYLTQKGSTTRKQFAKIKEFAKMNNYDEPKTKLEAANWLIKLYLSNTNEFCKKGAQFNRTKKSRISANYTTASRFDDDLADTAKQIDAVLDANEDKYIKLGFAKAYLVFYRGYYESDLSELKLYVHTKDLKEFISKTDVTHSKYLNSLKWAQMKDYVRERDNYICSKCGANMIDDLYNLHTHHLTYDRLGDENPDTDLVLLCKPCHSNEHKKKK